MDFTHGYFTDSFSFHIYFFFHLTEMARILQSIRKCKASLSSFSSPPNSSTDELIRKKNKKSNKIKKNKIKKNKFSKKKNDDVMVYIPYCADQKNELKKKVRTLQYT